jgi:predicted acetylornithine/succinylornithine family transaminase
MCPAPKQEVIDKTNRYIFNTYRRAPLVLTRGKGSTVWDSGGKEYLDLVSGIAVLNVGHLNPAVIEAIHRQSETLMQVSNLFYSEPQAALAELLVNNSFADKVFFCNSGAEANEAAIKLARKYSHDRGQTGRFEIISMEGSFHGRTMATLSATGQEKFHRGFEPLLPGFRYVPFNDAEALEKAVTAATCAVMLEPIQGEGGVNCPAPDYLKQVRRICDQAGLLLIFDEVQVGMGRTGKLFAYQHYGIAPDIMTLAKGLGGGVPIGAMLGTDKIAPSFSPGTHASTFGGNPLSTAAGVAAMHILLQDGFLETCEKRGAYFYDRLIALKQKLPVITGVRGKGLILALELAREGADVVTRCMEQGVLINCTMDRVLRFIPPLCITEGEIDTALAAVENSLSAIA